MMNMGGNNSQFPAKLPVFDGKHYDRWVKQMKVLFRYQDVVEIVKDGVTTTTGDALRDQKKKDNKAIFLIHQCVDAEVFERISEYETAKEAWDALETAYSGDAKLKTVKLQTLKKQYELLKMEDQDSIIDYINRLTVVVNQMKINGKKIDEQEKVEKILRTLDNSYSYALFIPYSILNHSSF